uniref:Uncharacterized protein LOC104211296 n=1 Tax=Nicotiana sylvestris TaxID=4096 RepID=A0A1U7V0Y2_NICSY
MLPEVLWVYQTTSKSITGATMFSLVYGVEALIPVEVGEPRFRFRYTMEESNHKAMNTSLELLDERREASLVRMAAQKQRIERYWIVNSNHFQTVQIVAFHVYVAVAFSLFKFSTSYCANFSFGPGRINRQP